MTRILRKTLKFLVCFTLMFQACDRGVNSQKDTNQHDIDSVTVDLKNKVYFFGPAIDSIAVDIITDCDCCASRFLFLDDTNFVYISYCLGGDSYFKGKYVRKNNSIFLHLDSLQVIKTIKEIYLDSSSTTFTEESVLEVSKFALIVPEVEISKLKNRPIISLKYKDGTEFGIEDKMQPMNTLIKELKKDSIWFKLNLK